MRAARSEGISWDAEVDVTAASLIRRGWPPWIAMKEAVRRVSKRRTEQQDDD